MPLNIKKISKALYPVKWKSNVLPIVDGTPNSGEVETSPVMGLLEAIKEQAALVNSMEKKGVTAGLDLALQKLEELLDLLADALSNLYRKFKDEHDDPVIEERYDEFREYIMELEETVVDFADQVGHEKAFIQEKTKGELKLASRQHTAELKQTFKAEKAGRLLRKVEKYEAGFIRAMVKFVLTLLNDLKENKYVSPKFGETLERSKYAPELGADHKNFLNFLSGFLAKGFGFDPNKGVAYNPSLGTFDEKSIVFLEDFEGDKPAVEEELSQLLVKLEKLQVIVDRMIKNEKKLGKLKSKHSKAIKKL